MSRDQKPAKMRVIAGGGQAPQPLRRFDDQEPEIAPTALVVAETPRRGKFLFLSLIYVACSAVGGVGVIMLLRSFAA